MRNYFPSEVPVLRAQVPGPWKYPQCPRSPASPHTLYLPLDLAEEGQRVQRDDDVLMYWYIVVDCEEEESEIVSINSQPGNWEVQSEWNARRPAALKPRRQTPVEAFRIVWQLVYAGGCCNDDLPRTTYASFLLDLTA